MVNKQPILYKPFHERTPDNQYEKLMEDILQNGISKTPIHARLPENINKKGGCLELSGRMLTYDLSNGVPLTTVRRVGYKGPAGEIIAFMNGARTLDELEKYGCPRNFWEGWLIESKCEKFGLETGDTGPGAYGPILSGVPMPDGRKFNQISALIRQMIEMPYLRTHAISTWYSPLALGDDKQDSPRKVVVAPCHGNFVQFNVFGKEMHMVHYQRSADVPVGLVINLIEWVEFGMMVAYMTNLQFTQYCHMLANPQIYEEQEENVRQLLTREPRRLPSLYLRPKQEIKSIFDFRRDDFVLEDYDPHPKMEMPTLV